MSKIYTWIARHSVKQNCFRFEFANAKFLYIFREVVEDKWNTNDNDNNNS